MPLELRMMYTSITWRETNRLGILNFFTVSEKTAVACFTTVFRHVRTCQQQFYYKRTELLATYLSYVI